MKFNPIKRILYTDKGEVIRKLGCPYKVSFSEPVSDAPNAGNICTICNGEIVETDGYDEASLLVLSQNINLCFKVDAYQHNVHVVYIQ